ncbi:MAG: outer membrane beta-barrel protein [Bdellovibrio sp.]|nr:outer membrane beta-barrel protein [Bdellovibrio sp.]
MLQFRNLMLITILGFSSFAATTALAAGGLFVEPMLTYERGDSTLEYPAPFLNSTGTISGVGLGARVGAHVNEVIFLALDARYAKPNFKNSSNNLDASSASYNYGPAVGVQTPLIGLRVWGSYVLGGELDPEESNNVDLKFTQAQGYRVGVGFQIIMLSLNLEYQDLKYGSTKVEKVGPFAASASDNINLKNKSYILSVSFPLEF